MLLWYICWWDQKIVVVLIIFYRFVRLLLLSVRCNITTAYWKCPPPIRHCVGDEAKMQWRMDYQWNTYEHLKAAMSLCLLLKREKSIWMMDQSKLTIPILVFLLHFSNANCWRQSGIIIEQFQELSIQLRNNKNWALDNLVLESFPIKKSFPLIPFVLRKMLPMTCRHWRLTVFGVHRARCENRQYFSVRYMRSTLLSSAREASQDPHSWCFSIIDECHAKMGHTEKALSNLLSNEPFSFSK